MKNIKRLLTAWFRLSFVIVGLIAFFPNTIGQSIQEAIPPDILGLLMLPACLHLTFFFLGIVQGELQNSLEKERRRQECRRDRWH